MLSKKRTKFSKMRGSSSHGGGHKKKRRGAGHRGGVGMSGGGKRADSKHQKVLKEKGKGHFGKVGFRSKNKIKINSINISYIENSYDKMSAFEDDKKVIDLSKMRVNKLLGSGKITRKVNLKVKFASKLAVEKIEKAGGKVEVLEKNKE